VNTIFLHIKLSIFHKHILPNNKREFYKTNGMSTLTESPMGVVYFPTKSTSASVSLVSTVLSVHITRCKWLSKSSETYSNQQYSVL